MEKLLNKDAWLDPNGKLHEVPDCGHNEFASKMIEDEMGFFEAYDYLDDKRLYPYEWLHERGWVRVKLNPAYASKVKILGGCIDLTRPMRNTMCPAMNQTQLRISKQICEDHGVSFHQAINDKRFW